MAPTAFDGRARVSTPNTVMRATASLGMRDPKLRDDTRIAPVQQGRLVAFGAMATRWQPSCNGALTWRLETEYNDRLTAAYVHLKELNAPVDALTRQYDAFVRTRQAATHSYVGHDVQIARLRERVDEALQRIDVLIARQGHMIETVAINQLEARRERLAAQQTEARFGVADSYDRAARAQSDGGGH